MNQFFERRYVIGGIFIALTLILLGRLFYIQIIDDRYLLYANKNVIRQFIKYPARGPILDRNGRTLVKNELVYDISVIPKQVKPFDTLEFCKLIGINKTEFDKLFLKAIKYSPNLSSSFEKQLSPQLYASLQERMSEFQGFSVEEHPIRSYPDSVAAQFLGGIGEVNDATIAKYGGYYRLGDYIGTSGVEKAYETVLRGQRGVQNKMVDSRGIPKGSYANGAYDTVAISGERLTSSLDITLQKLGEKLMQNKVGSIVAIEPSTGEILAFVSSPGYDPNLLVGHDRGTNYHLLATNPYKPFLVRPIQANYPPGSSFKPLSALIALQEGIITPQTTYNCPGYYMSGNRQVKCTHVHGIVNLSGAVAGSCNGYFSMVFQKLIDKNGPKLTDTTFNDWRNNVAKFGLGSRIGVDLPAERAGYLPKAALYDKMYKGPRWRASTVLSLAIGQGELGATPLQLANIECTIANHGFYYTPHLIKGIGTKNIIKPEYLIKHDVGIDYQYFEPVIDGMQAVVENGTAIQSKIPGIIMCGKTGTAQNPHGENHSIFVAFAPRENPKIAIAVIVENSGEGAHWAAPIASFIVEKYLTGSISPRESGITPEHFIEANRLPEITTYSGNKAKTAKADSIKKLKLDSIRKKGLIKSASNKNKKDIPIKYLAAIKPKDDE
ncbi:penicillin-binding protein 2 [Mucilaginibacter sp.]|uniref:penicillin-binding protein 2 n=1 Tax=Mucilaginibacter sp. TaxID=1882438 RepID=UPI00262EED29|nr:penicillin-binding protein 2 [Mucilaginibacter sp.]MDB4924991.1 spoVD [Mucilaginibacter sp.]